MLEIKNLSKTYTIKKGVPVKAIDDVSLNIQDKGMVFVLGKSGSGKSTLLNLLGGLDKYDEGEIKIQGKSTKDFTQADFDSYRNTFIGFIFQDYNILEELTVGQNIALAILLQGRKPTDDELNDILCEVDLEGYAKRRPNELSGGQLQRVAIARALVKNPKIIMADEPTGALDSNTGIQVFETLKKISKDKLVLVVSHDREFSERYADRIIELADGKIISDVKKVTLPQAEISLEKPKVLHIDDDNVLHIKKGFKLTKKDYELINFYLEKSTKDTAEIIYDDTEKTPYKQRVDDEGNVAVFREIQSTTAIENVDKELVSIKSALPFKNSLKMGANSLKVKIFRLVMMIILSTVAFTLFGLVATIASFKNYTTMANTIVDNQIDYINIQTETKFSPATGLEQKCIRESDIDILAKLNPATKFLKVYSGDYSSSVQISLKYIDNLYYTDGRLAGLVETDMTEDEFTSTYGLEITGSLPKADNEIVITKYVCEYFIFTEKVTTQTDMIGYDIVIVGMGTFTVTGIIDTKLSTEYDVFKGLPRNTKLGNKNNKLYQLFQNDTNYGFHNLAFVNSGYLDKNIVGNRYKINTDNIELSYVNSTLTPDELKLSKPKTTFMLDEGISKIPGKKSTKLFFDDGKTKLEDNEVLIPFGLLSDVTRQEILISIEQRIMDYCLDIENVPQEIKEMGSYSLNLSFNLKEYYQYYCANNVPTNLDYSRAYFAWLKYSYDDDIYAGRLVVQEIIQDEILSAAEKYSTDTAFYLNNRTQKTLTDVKVVGCILSPLDYYFESTSAFEIFSLNYEVVMTKELMNELGLETYGIYSNLLGNVPSAEKDIKHLTKAIYTYNKNGESYTVSNSVSEAITHVTIILEYLDIFLSAAIGFAVFAMLLMSNYISTSISHKKKEIGVLRALGARGKDVLGIFFNEAMIIALINFVLSTLAAGFSVLGLNFFFRSQLLLNITMLNFGILQILLILGTSLVAGILSSFLPVYYIARKRPIDAIRNK